jgi:hypothetical protein
VSTIGASTCRNDKHLYAAASPECMTGTHHALSDSDQSALCGGLFCERSMQMSPKNSDKKSWRGLQECYARKLDESASTHRAMAPANPKKYKPSPS